MEALERLQAVHGHLRLLHTHGIATAHAPTNRFLADFLLLLGESGKSSAEMERLCEVLVDALPKMKASTLFDEMVHVNTPVSDSKPRCSLPRIKSAAEVKNVTPHEGLSNRRGHPLNDSQNLRTSEVVGEQMSPTQQQRSASSEGGVLNCMLDEQNEDQLYLSPMTGGSKPSHGVSSKVANGLGRDPFAGLRAILYEQDLLTKRIEDELMDGVQYWRLEQSLCTALSTREEVKVEDVLQALRLKSFDYRVLNLLLYGLRNEPVNEAHYEFLSISELLVEIADDLYDYEEDVGKNSFNVLRMFLYTFGPREAPTMLADFIGKSEDKYKNLLEELEPNIRAEYNKRCEEAVKEGGSKSLHVLGSWTIPSLITDEDAFRKQIM